MTQHISLVYLDSFSVHFHPSPFTRPSFPWGQDYSHVNYLLAHFQTVWICTQHSQTDEHQYEQTSTAQVGILEACGLGRETNNGLFHEIGEYPLWKNLMSKELQSSYYIQRGKNEINCVQGANSLLWLCPKGIMLLICCPRRPEGRTEIWSSLGQIQPMYMV